MLRNYKLVVLGDGGVGKSSLIVQFVQNQFIEEYDPTVEDFYRKKTVVDGQPCLIEIVDTAGQSELSTLKDYAWWRTADGFLLVFAFNDADSLANIPHYRDQVRRNSESGDEVPMVLVGNKTDVMWRAVDRRSAQQLATSYSIPYVQASARSRLGVDAAFFTLMREIRRHDYNRTVLAQRSPASSISSIMDVVGTSVSEQMCKKRGESLALRKRSIGCMPLAKSSSGGSCSVV